MKFLFATLFYLATLPAYASTIVNCTVPQNDVQQFICQDAVLNDLNNQSTVLALQIADADYSKRIALEQKFHGQASSCGFNQSCWAEAYQDLIAGYEDLKRLYESKTNVQNSKSSNSDSFWTSFSFIFFTILLFLGAIFFLPSIIAFNREHRNRWVILVINIVFGFTLLGWLVALIWSLNKIDSPLKGGTKYDSQPHDPSI
jgi:hypothetical protein